MGKLKIRTFKRWFQVVHNGYTVAQFLSRHEAEDYVRQEGGGGQHPQPGNRLRDDIQPPKLRHDAAHQDISLA